MDSNSSRPETHNNYPLNSKIMLSAIIILFSIVLLILAVHLYVRYFIHRRNDFRRQRNLVFSSSSSAAPPRSLDPSILNSLPVLIFDADVASETECAVCLCEFVEGEKVRVLPRCEHCFHVGCIDMWFGFHGSCPLCRTAVGEVVTGKEAIDHSCAEGEGGSSTSDMNSVDGDDGVSIEIEDAESAEINSNLGENNSSRLVDLIKRLLSRNRRLSESSDEAAVDVV